MCRNRSCVNPTHLEAVTHAVNNQRGARAKLNTAVVAEIRSRYTGKHGEQSSLAREYGVTAATIHDVVRGKSWTD